MAGALQSQEIAIANLCTRWQTAANAHRPVLVNHDVARFTVGAKMFHLCLGSSSAFIVDIVTGTIYGNKGWLKVDRSKIVGNAYDPNFDAAVLVRDRFRYGRFENNPDGSLRQPIVMR